MPLQAGKESDLQVNTNKNKSMNMI